MQHGITVDVEARIVGYEGQIQEIRAALKQIGEDSDIGKGLVKSLMTAEKAVNQFGSNLNKRVTSNQGLEKIYSQAENIDQMFLKMGQTLSNVKWSDLTTDLDVAISAIQKQIAALSQAYTTDIKNGLKNTIKQSGDLSKVFSELKLDPEKMDLSEIDDKLTQAIDNSKQKVIELQQEYDALSEKANAAMTKVANIKNLPAIKNTSVGLTQDVKNMFSQVDFSFNKKPLQEYIRTFQSEFKQLENVSTEAKNNIQRILGELGQVSTADEAREKLKELSDAYKELGQGSMTRNTSDFRQITQLINSLVPKGDTGHQIQNLMQQLQQFFQMYQNLGMSNEMQDRITRLLSPDATVQNIKDAQALVIQAIKDYFTNLNKEISEGEKESNKLNLELSKKEKEITTEQDKGTLYEKASTDYLQAINDLQVQLKTQEQTISNLEEKLRNLESERLERDKTPTEPAKIGEKVQEKSKSNIKENTAQLKQYSAELAKVESQEQALGQINSFIQKWFSASAAIRMVESAFNNIKNTVRELDDVMTKIAIVTDQTQEDLWGQMDRYTAMAKQYAVSIKGVYEVSQLFYQQGLGTNDVMALSEQTLKMAKISGLDYTDATNYMTNAIRSFKMEMTDAQTVVDVYSAIAASSATDTAELATAMSKTASAAESVGASFENTTAMMAVMIEATRESATNIGSAMKSIIARYGEMTKNPGQLIDSEGEAMSLNKVDAALQSVGISIHDTMGQFRNFDDVIMELAEHWDTIDKNTQRYIATTMAGNRQQSRFLAMVSNYERLQELSEKAANSEDAATLQVLKSMDSISAKAQQLQTSLQSLYTKGGIETLYKGVLDNINNVINTLNDLPRIADNFPGAMLLTISSLFSRISQVVTVLFANIQLKYQNLKQILSSQNSQVGQETVRQAETTTNQVINTIRNKIPQGREAMDQLLMPSPSLGQKIKTKIGTILSNELNATKIGTALTGMGTAIQLVSMQMDKSTTSARNFSVALNAIGGIAATAGQIMTKNYAGAALTAATTITSVLNDIIVTTEEKINKLEQAITSTSNKKLQSKNELKTLTDYKKKYDELYKTRNLDTESKQKWIDLNNEIADKYPELIENITAEGNYIINLNDAYQQLAESKAAVYKTDFIDNLKAELNGLNDIDYFLQKYYGQKALPNKAGFWDQGSAVVQPIGQAYSDFIAGKTSEFKPNLSINQGQTVKHLFHLSDQQVLNPNFGFQLGMDTDVLKNDYEVIYEAIIGEIGTYISQGFSLFDAASQIIANHTDWKEKIPDLDTILYNFDTQLVTYFQLVANQTSYADELLAQLYERKLREYLQILSQLTGITADNITFDIMSSRMLTQWKQQKQSAIESNQLSEDYTEGDLFSDFLTNAMTVDWYKNTVQNASKNYQNKFLNTLTNNANKYTKSQFESELMNSQLELTDQEINELLNVYFNEKTDQAIKDYEAAIDDLTNTATSQNTIFDGDYLKSLSNYFGTAFFSQILKSYNDILSNDNLTTAQKNLSISNLDYLYDQIAMSDDKIKVMDQLDTLDLSSISDIYTLIEFLQSHIIDDGGEIATALEQLASTIHINFFTEFNSAISAITSQIKDFGTSIQNASKGMSLDEAAEFIDQFNLNLTELTFKGGKYYFKDLNLLKEKFFKQNEEFNQVLDNRYNNLITFLNDEQDVYSYIDQNLNSFQNLDLEQQIQQLRTTVGQDWGNKYSDQFISEVLSYYNAYIDVYNALSPEKKNQYGSFTNYLIKQLNTAKASLDQINEEYLNYAVNSILLQNGQIKDFLESVNPSGDDHYDIFSALKSQDIAALNAREYLRPYISLLLDAYKDAEENVFSAGIEALSSGKSQFIEATDANQEILSTWNGWVTKIVQTGVDGQKEILGYYTNITIDNLTSFVDAILHSSLGKLDKINQISDIADMAIKNHSAEKTNFTNEASALSNARGGDWLNFSNLFVELSQDPKLLYDKYFTPDWYNGNVKNLWGRPHYTKDDLASYGYNIDEDSYATLLSSGFTVGADQNIQIIATPLTGLKDVKTEDELQKYINEITDNGKITDIAQILKNDSQRDNLILSAFEGTIEESNRRAQEIHELQEQWDEVAFSERWSNGYGRLDPIKNLNLFLSNFNTSLEDGILKFADNANIYGALEELTSFSELFGFSDEYTAEIATAMRTLMQNVTTGISNGIKGGLNENDVLDLQKTLSAVGINTELDFTESADGLKLTKDAAIGLYQELQKIDVLAASLVFDDLFESLTEAGHGLENATATAAEIKRLNDQIADNQSKIDTASASASAADQAKVANLEAQNNKLREQVELYGQIQQRQMMNPDTYDFMGRNLPDYLQGPQNYWDSIGKAFEAVREAGASGYMEIQDFYNIVNEMNNIASISGETLTFMGQQLGGKAADAANLIEQGLSHLSNIDGKGVKIDLSGFGIDIATGLKGMSDGFDSGLDDLADSQIQMLDAAISVLETVVAIGQMGDIDVDESGTIDLSDVFPNIEIDPTDTSIREETQVAINTLLENAEKNETLKTALEEIKVENYSLKQIFDDAADGVLDTTVSAETFIQILQAFSDAFKNGDFNVDPSQLLQNLQVIFGENFAGLDFTIGDKTLRNGQVLNAKSVDDAINYLTQEAHMETTQAQAALSQAIVQGASSAANEFDPGYASVLIAHGLIKVEYNEEGQIIKYIINGNEYNSLDEASDQYYKDLLTVIAKDKGINVPSDIVLDENDNESKTITVTQTSDVGYEYQIQVGLDGSTVYKTNYNGQDYTGNSLDDLVQNIINGEQQKLKSTGEYQTAGPEEQILMEKNLAIQIRTNVTGFSGGTVQGGLTEAVDQILANKQAFIDQINAALQGHDADETIELNIGGFKYTATGDETGESITEKILELYDPEHLIDKIAQGIEQAFATNEDGSNKISEALAQGIRQALVDQSTSGEGLTIPEGEVPTITVNKLKIKADSIEPELTNTTATTDTPESVGLSAVEIKVGTGEAGGSFTFKFDGVSYTTKDALTEAFSNLTNFEGLTTTPTGFTAIWNGIGVTIGTGEAGGSYTITFDGVDYTDQESVNSMIEALKTAFDFSGSPDTLNADWSKASILIGSGTDGGSFVITFNGKTYTTTSGLSNIGSDLGGSIGLESTPAGLAVTWDNISITIGTDANGSVVYTFTDENGQSTQYYNLDDISNLINGRKLNIQNKPVTATDAVTVTVGSSGGLIFTYKGIEYAETNLTQLETAIAESNTIKVQGTTIDLTDAIQITVDDNGGAIFTIGGTPGQTAAQVMDWIDTNYSQLTSTASDEEGATGNSLTYTIGNGISIVVSGANTYTINGVAGLSRDAAILELEGLGEFSSSGSATVNVNGTKINITASGTGLVYSVNGTQYNTKEAATTALSDLLGADDFSVASAFINSIEEYHLQNNIPAGTVTTAKDTFVTGLGTDATKKTAEFELLITLLSYIWGEQGQNTNKDEFLGVGEDGSLDFGHGTGTYTIDSIEYKTPDEQQNQSIVMRQQETGGYFIGNEKLDEAKDADLEYVASLNSIVQMGQTLDALQLTNLQKIKDFYSNPESGDPIPGAENIINLVQAVSDGNEAAIEKNIQSLKAIFEAFGTTDAEQIVSLASAMTELTTSLETLSAMEWPNLVAGLNVSEITFLPQVVKIGGTPKVEANGSINVSGDNEQGFKMDNIDIAHSNIKELVIDSVETPTLTNDLELASANATVTDLKVTATNLIPDAGVKELQGLDFSTSSSTLGGMHNNAESLANLSFDGLSQQLQTIQTQLETIQTIIDSLSDKEYTITLKTTGGSGGQNNSGGGTTTTPTFSFDGLLVGLTEVVGAVANAVGDTKSKIAEFDLSNVAKEIGGMSDALDGFPDATSAANGLNSLSTALSNIAMASSAASVASTFAEAMEKVPSGSKSLSVKFTYSAAAGSAKAKGTSGDALASGKRRTLMGELGPELVVSNGRYFVVGTNGAEFVNLAQDAIVFNHLQTRRLIEQGAISSRGQPLTNELNAVAYAKGTIPLTGPAKMTSEGAGTSVAPAIKVTSISPSSYTLPLYSYAKGNIKGFAAASAEAALAALKEIRAMWESLRKASPKSLGALAGSGKGGKGGGSGGGGNGGDGGGGGGGGGGDADNFQLTAATAEIQRWYNLLRQIERLEKDITYEEQLQNTLMADQSENGELIYQSYKKQLSFLDQEIVKQKQLLELQRSWLQARVADLEDPNKSVLARIFTYDTEKRLLQYRGNGTPDSGLGLDILEQLNRRDINGQGLDHAVSSAAQLMYLEGLGLDLSMLLYKDDGTKIANMSATGDLYDAVTKERLIGEDLNNARTEMVERFFEMVESEMDELDSLQDSIDDTEKSILDEQAKANDILQKLIDNQLEIEKAVLKAIEDREQQTIDQLKDEEDAIKDAADKFVEGLNQQLDREKKMYENNEQDQELVKLQRQLAILQRSGGSAAQIKNLQDQITAKQQDMYFNAQQEQIEAIQEASDKEIERLDAQLKVMEESLSYQKEHGLLWEEVYAVMNLNKEEITHFVSTYDKNYTSFSTLEYQEKIIDLLDKIGIWTEQRDDSENIFMADFDRQWATFEEAFKEPYSDLWDENIDKLKNKYKDTFMSTGKYNMADAATLDLLQELGGRRLPTPESTEEVSPLPASPRLKQDPDVDYQKDPNYLQLGDTGSLVKKLQEHLQRNQNLKEGSYIPGIFDEATEAALVKYQRHRYYLASQITGKWELWQGKLGTFSSGGLINYTGPAMVHGSKNHPEGILNAEETEFFREDFMHNAHLLTNILRDVDIMMQDMSDTGKYNGVGSAEAINIENAQVIMNVDSIANDYDAQRAGEQALEEMLKIARKSGTRAISRR